MSNPTWECYAEGPYVVTEWAGQTARKLCKPKNAGKANETTAEQQAEQEAAAKRAKRAKAEGRTIKPMLAKTYAAKKFVPGSTVQPKLDGVRCLAYWEHDRVVLQSCGGDDYPVEHIRRAVEATLEPGDTFDGELYIHGRSLQEIVSLVKRPQEGSQALEYWIYDRPSEKSSRFRMPYPGSFTHPLRAVLGKIAYAPEDVRKINAEHVSKGFEGSIIRAPFALYDYGKRSWRLMKLKEWQDDEFEIMGWKTGEGKFSDVPIFRCKTRAGKEFDCNPPGDMAARRALLPKADALVGQQLTVKFFDWTDDGLPHFPVGLNIREPGE